MMVFERRQRIGEIAACLSPVYLSNMAIVALAKPNPPPKIIDTAAAHSLTLLQQHCKILFKG